MQLRLHSTASLVLPVICSAQFGPGEAQQFRPVGGAKHTCDPQTGVPPGTCLFTGNAKDQFPLQGWHPGQLPDQTLSGSTATKNCLIWAGKSRIKAFFILMLRYGYDYNIIHSVKCLCSIV